jgi:hypothetical protein
VGDVRLIRSRSQSSLDSDTVEAHQDGTTLPTVLLSELCSELKRRGYQVLPACAWENMMEQLEKQSACVALAIERMKLAAGEIPDGMVDGTQLCRELGEQVHELSEGVHWLSDRVAELKRENAELRERADRAEQEAATLIGDGITALEREANEGTA